jgi:flagellar hook-length control protein FliK
VTPARSDADNDRPAAVSPAASALAARLSRMSGSVSAGVDAASVTRFVEATADGQGRPLSPHAAGVDLRRVPASSARESLDTLAFARSGLTTSPGLIHAAQPSPPAAAVVAMTDAAPADNAGELIQSIRLLSTRGGGEMHIRLQPRHFGDLQISVRVDDGQVVTRLTADSAVVREWLQSNQGLLRQALEDQGLSLHRLEVQESEAEARARQERQSRGDQSEDRQPRRRRPDTGAVFEVVA